MDSAVGRTDRTDGDVVVQPCCTLVRPAWSPPLASTRLSLVHFEIRTFIRRYADHPPPAQYSAAGFRVGSRWARGAINQTTTRKRGQYGCLNCKSRTRLVERDECAEGTSVVNAAAICFKASGGPCVT